MLISDWSSDVCSSDPAVLGIGVLSYQFGAPHPAAGQPAWQIDADTDRALVQVGLAIRQACRQADHGHHRVAEEYDDADIGHAAKTDLIEEDRKSTRLNSSH